MLRLLNYCGRDAADAGDDSAAAGAAIVVVARSLYTYRLIIQCSICSYLCHYCHFLRNWFLPKQFPDKKVTKPRGLPPQPGEPQGHPGLRNPAPPWRPPPPTLRRMATEECQLKLDGNCHAPRKFKNYCGNCFKKAPAIFSSDKIGTIQRRLAALYSSDTIETIQRRLAAPY